MKIADMTDRPPHVILIVLHGMGDFLSVYDRPGVHTPWLDSLSYQGMMFQNYTITHPTSAPTIEPYYSQIVPPLNTAGYLTHAIAPPLPATHPYQEHTTTDGTAQQASAHATQFLIDHAPDIDKPFLLTLSITELMRRPADGHFRDHYDPDLPGFIELPPTFPTTDPVKHDYAQYVCALQSVDFYLARIMDELEERGYEDETLVILTSDGGPEFPRMRGTHYAAAYRSALLIRWSSILPGSYRSPALLTPDHLTTTIIDLAGVPLTPAQQPLTIRPLLDADPYPGPDTLHIQATPTTHTIRDHRYTLTHHTQPLTPSPSPPLYLKRHNQPTAPQPPPPPAELHDLHTDPWQQTNLIDHPQHQQIQDKLTAQLNHQTHPE